MVATSQKLDERISRMETAKEKIADIASAAGHIESAAKKLADNGFSMEGREIQGLIKVLDLLEPWAADDQVI